MDEHLLFLFSFLDEVEKEIADDAEKQVWNGLIAQGHQIVTALDVIEAVLLGGEKDRIIDEINKMSGFNSENIEEVENNLEDVTKN